MLGTTASRQDASSPQPLPAQRELNTAGGTSEPPADLVVDPNLPPEPDSPRTFARRQRELARDLIIKEQQIEYLISVLPGIGSSEAQQESRIRHLADELRAVECHKERKARELNLLRKRLDKVLETVQVGLYGDRPSFTKQQ